MKKLFKKIGAGFAAASGASLMTAAVVAMMGCTDNGGNVANGVSEETSVALKVHIDALARIATEENSKVVEVSGLPFVPKTVKYCKLDEVSFSETESCRTLDLDNDFDFELNIDFPKWKYGLLTVAGELKTHSTSEEVKCHAIVDANDLSTINVNVLTEWKYAEVLRLVSQGVSTAQALDSAEQVVLKKLGVYGEYEKFEKMTISGTTRSDAVLIAASYLAETTRELDHCSFDESCLLRMAIYDFDNQYLLNGSYFEEAGFARPSKEMLQLASDYVSNYIAVLLELGQCDNLKEGGFHEVGWSTDGPVWGKFPSNTMLMCHEGLWIRQMKESLHTVGSMTDARDGRVYKTTSFIANGETQTWMSENLKYALNGKSRCPEKDPKKCDDEGNLYTWLEAMNLDTTGYVQDGNLDSLLGDLAEMLGDDYASTYLQECVESRLDELDDLVAYQACSLAELRTDELLETIDVQNHQGICPDGWRIPSREDWMTLLNFVGYPSVYGAWPDVVEFGLASYDEFVFIPEKEPNASDDRTFIENDGNRIGFAYPRVYANHTNEFGVPMSVRCIKN